MFPSSVISHSHLSDSLSSDFLNPLLSTSRGDIDSCAAAKNVDTYLVGAESTSFLSKKIRAYQASHISRLIKKDKVQAVDNKLTGLSTSIKNQLFYYFQKDLGDFVLDLQSADMLRCLIGHGLSPHIMERSSYPQFLNYGSRQKPLEVSPPIDLLISMTAYALKNHKLELVSVLIDAGVNMEQVLFNLNVSHGALELLLQEHGLHLKSEVELSKYIKIIDQLIDKGVSLNTVYHNQTNPLYLSMGSNALDAELTRYLIHKGADQTKIVEVPEGRFSAFGSRNLNNKISYTTLDFALRYDFAHCVKVLLEENNSIALAGLQKRFLSPGAPHALQDIYQNACIQVQKRELEQQLERVCEDNDNVHKADNWLPPSEKQRIKKIHKI